MICSRLMVPGTLDSLPHNGAVVTLLSSVPEPITATRCMSAGSMSFPAASSMYALPSASSAMVRPPEAEPVSAASTLVATASDTRGPPQPFGHEPRDGGHAAAVVHELAEQGAKQKQREELGQEGRRTAHEGLCPVGEQRLQRECGGKQRGGWSEKEHAPAAQREPNEQRQSE